MINKEYVRAVYNALDAYHGGWALKTLEESSRSIRNNMPFDEWLVQHALLSVNSLIEHVDNSLNNES